MIFVSHMRIDRLKKFIPEKLFAESNLPEVTIFLRELNGKRIKLDVENVSLSISSAGYLPAKPTYRPGKGVIVPLRVPWNMDAVVTDVSQSYDLRGYPVVEDVGDVLPEEYSALLLSLGLKRVRVRPKILIGITLDEYECEKGEGIRWGFFGRKRHNILLEKINNDSYEFYLYKDKSISFARFFVDRPVARFSDENQLCFNHIKVKQYDVLNIYKGIYAVDVNALLTGKFKFKHDDTNRDNNDSSNSKKRSKIIPIKKSKCLKDDNLKKARNYYQYFVKIFVDKKPITKEYEPITMGYEIISTKMLEIDVGELSSLVNFKPRCFAEDLAAKYRCWSLNTSYVNGLRHLLSHDLVLNYYFSQLGYAKIEKLINLIILLNDLYYQEKEILSNIIQQLQNSNDGGDKNKRFAELLRSRIRSLTPHCNSDVQKDPRGRLVYYFLSESKGAKLEVYRWWCKGETDEVWGKIFNRLNNLIEKWYKKYIIEIIRHTYSHHIIKILSLRYSMPPDKFLERYTEWESEMKVSIVENESGGVGILPQFANRGKSPEMAEDFILSFGKCLVGTPGDLLHFALANIDEWRDKDISAILQNIIERLNIIITPEEFEEAKKLWNSILDEAKNIVKLVGRSSEDDALLILRDIHRLRWELENKIKRFPEFDELLVYVVAHLNSSTLLREVVKKLLDISLDNNTKRTLAEIYAKQTKFIDEFLNDIQFTLALGKSNSGVVDKCVFSKDDEKCETVVSSIKRLRRVLRGLLMRLALLSCNSACGMCYVNNESCSRYSAPFIQARTLDRRVAKIIASEFVKRYPEVKNYCDVKDGVVVEVGGRKYGVACDVESS
jgi:hypothetical protein